MTPALSIHGLAGVERIQADGSFIAYQPGAPMPTPIREGDRLHVQLTTSGSTWLYAVAALDQHTFWKLGIWPPAAPATSEPRTLWPCGRVLSSAEVRMTTLFVIASPEQLSWAHDLTRADCSSLVGKMPARPPVTSCDHLYGLFWKAQPRPRGLVPPKVETLHDGDAQLPAIAAAHRDTPYVVLEWQFTQRG